MSAFSVPDTFPLRGPSSFLVCLCVRVCVCVCVNCLPLLLQGWAPPQVWSLADLFPIGA